MALSSSTSSSHSKSGGVQLYSLALYRGALHPEFFAVEGRQQITHQDYDFESWIFRGGHVLRFEHNGFCLTEVVGESIDGLPDRGHVTTMPCAGERDFEQEFADRVAYMTSMQTETLTGHLFLATVNELHEHARQNESQLSVWGEHENGASNLSLLDIQRYSEEVHVQAYHLRADCGLVLRTQSIFQIKRS